MIKELKSSGLYPYKRPSDCTIRKSGQLARKDWVAAIFDTIYINSHTRIGYHIMRLWIRIFRIKQKFKINR